MAFSGDGGSALASPASYQYQFLTQQILLAPKSPPDSPSLLGAFPIESGGSLDLSSKGRKRKRYRILTAKLKELSNPPLAIIEHLSLKAVE